MKFFSFNRTGGTAMIEKKPSKSTIKSMPKRELSKIVADLAGFSKADVEKILNCYLCAITTALQDDRPVTLHGFGKFKPRKPRAGGCRNPITEKKISAPQRKSVSFQPSSIIKQKLTGFPGDRVKHNN